MSDKYPGGFVTTGAPAGSSVYFDGTGDYLSMSSGTSLGAGNFTIECWVYLTAAAAGETTIGSSTNYYTAGYNGNFVFRIGTTNLWRSFDGQSNQVTLDGTFTWSTGQWYHMAWVRNSGTVTVYRNGTSLGSVADSKTLSDSANGYGIAATKSGGTYASLVTGYISNLRVVVGTALYTTTFTPPTQLLNISGTSLLTCNSPTIIDQSTNAYAITVFGDSKVSNFTPFAGYTGFNPALGAAAGGVWTLDEAAYYQNNRKWPIYDPYFNQTTLMLHGNGTNGAQNNTFLDSSTNNFTITRNGNATQGTFTPFSQTGWSTYFPATTDYISLPLSSCIVAANDFSLEMWVYVPAYSNTAFFNSQSDSTTTSGSSWGLSLNPGGTVYSNWYVGGGTVTLTTTALLPLNTWVHLALVRTGGTFSIFFNGVIAATRSDQGTNSINNGATNYNPYINRNGSGNNGTICYISNFRLIIGSGGYNATQNFTPPTTQLTATTNTRILACQSNRFVDNSANNYTLTPSGNPSVQAFSPFVPAYITPTTYSNWFDGTGDYLSSSSANYTATGDFTAEAWFYATSNPSFGGIINTRPQTNTTGWAINLDSAQKIRFYINGTDFPSGYVAYNLNQWYHVALVRSGSTVTGYINGISAGTTTNSSTTSTTDLVIGRFYSDLDNYYLNGVVSNARFVNGTALYTANFTPPNAPFPTGTTNQQLLTCQASTLIDSNTYTTAKTITANGNVRPVTSPTPFPAKVDTTTLNSAYSTSLIGGSAYFDGSGDYLSVPDNAALEPGSSVCCFEFWYYPTSISSVSSLLSKRANGSSNGSLVLIRGAGSSSVLVYLSSTGAGWDIASGVSMGSVVLNQWNHLALYRISNTWYGAINGVVTTVVASNSAAIYNGTTAWYIGAESDGQSTTGYLSGNRIVIGSSVYTAGNFAPPVAPPTAVTNTQLLLNYTNAGIYDNTAKNVLETVGNAQISTTQSKWGGSSIYFDGTGDWLQTQTTTNGNYNFTFGSADFTIEMWVYPTNSNSVCLIQGQTDNSTISGSSFLLRYTGTTDFYSGGTAYTCTSATPTANQWSHIAYVRNGTSLKTYLNGVQVGSATLPASTTAMNTGSTANATRIGAYIDGTGAFTGYIDDLRITKGYARYTTNFTPPTSQLQDQ